MKELPLAKAFILIEPGPVTLVTTALGRRKNIMTVSWTVVMDFTPKLAFVTGAWNHSFHALLETKECVIAIPTVDMSETVVGIGTCSGADTDKFKKFGLTPVKAKTVTAPLIAECFANIECRVIDYVKKHDLFVLEGLRAWIDSEASKRRAFHAVGDGTFVADGRRFSHRALMEEKLPAGVELCPRLRPSALTSSSPRAIPAACRALWPRSWQQTPVHGQNARRHDFLSG